MPLNVAARNAMLDHWASLVDEVSLHTADPGGTGANEATGGSPAYARKSITWNAASAGALDSSNQPVFDVPSGTYTHIGFWDATGPTNYGDADITDETFAGQGTYTLTDCDITAT